MNERLTDERHRIRILPVAPSHIPASTVCAREEIEPDGILEWLTIIIKALPRNECHRRDQYDGLGTHQNVSTKLDERCFEQVVTANT
jgi:hypothetical protein